MAEWVGSRQMAELAQGMGPLLAFLTEGAWTRRRGQPGVADFVVGDPHEMPLPAFVEALQRAAVPRHRGWFGYPLSLPAARATVADSLRAWRGLPFAADDIMLTNGGFAAIAVALRAVVDPGDEVIFISPPWFFYETLIRASGGQPVRVGVRPARRRRPARSTATPPRRRSARRTLTGSDS